MFHSPKKTKPSTSQTPTDSRIPTSEPSRETPILETRNSFRKIYEATGKHVKDIKYQLSISGNIKRSIKDTIIEKTDALKDIIDKIVRALIEIEEEQGDGQTIKERIVDGCSSCETLEQVVKSIKPQIEDCYKKIDNGNKEYFSELNKNLIKLREDIKVQNTTAESTKEEIICLKEELRELKTRQVPVSQTQDTVQPTYAEIAAAKPPKPTHCLLVGTKDHIDTSADAITKVREILKPHETGLQLSKLRKVKDKRILIGSENSEEYDNTIVRRSKI